MKIGVLSSVSRYKELLEAEESIASAVISESLEEMEFDALLIDGKNVSYRELEGIRERFPTTSIFYKLHEVKAEVVTKTITRICVAHKIKPLNEYYTVEQTVKEVVKHLTENDDFASHPIVSFFGTHSGVGVSTTVLNLARAISERVQDKVLVLSLNAWDPSDYFYDYRGMYLNDLKVDLKSKALTKARLHEALHYQKSFYHLAGNRDVKMQRYFNNEEIQHLIEVAKEDFDLILIDGGTHFDTAVAAQSYLDSNLKFVVTNQEDKGYRGYFPYTFQQLIEPVGGKRDDFMLIINRYQINMSLINEKDLEEDMEMNRIATIPDMGPVGTISMRQKRLMYEDSDNIYRKPIDVISNLIISEAQLTEKPQISAEEEHPKRGMFGLFGKK